MRNTLLLSVVALCGFAAQAVTVTTEAGGLATHISDNNVTQLTIAGTIDARDFKFMHDSLTRLQTLDLSSASIVAYHSVNGQNAFRGISDYEADALPSTCFFGSGLTQVTLPANLKTVGYAAFAGCTQLTAIELPGTVDSIGAYAFSGSGLTSITVPATVRSMGESAFSRCASLATATINSKHISDYAFASDTALAQCVLGENVLTLGSGAFGGCTALQSITTSGAALQTIGSQAFINSGVHALNLSGAKNIGDWAFSGSALTQATVPAGAKLGEGAFYYATALTSVGLPSSLTRLPDYSLSGDSQLAGGQTLLPQGMTEMGDYALYNCSGINSLVIPASMTQIGYKAMAGATGLDTIRSLATTVPALADSVWAGVDQPRVMLDIASAQVAAQYEGAAQWKEFHVLKDHTLGDVNRDGQINATDVAVLVAHILGETTEDFDLVAADVDQNGVYNSTDLSLLVDLVLGESSATTVRRAPAKGNEIESGDALHIQDFAIKPGETRTVSISLSNSQPYRALQADLVLPQGLSVVAGSLHAGKRANGFSAESRLLSDGATTRVLCFDKGGSTFSEGDDAVLTLTVQASDELSAQSAISITRVLFVSNDLKSVYGADTQTRVSSTTGIDDVNAASVKVWASGTTLVIESATQGIAQLVAMNGTAQQLAYGAGHNEYDNLTAGVYVVRVGGKSVKVVVK